MDAPEPTRRPRDRAAVPDDGPPASVTPGPIAVLPDADAAFSAAIERAGGTVRRTAS